MRDLVERFAEVEQDGIYLFSIIQRVRKVLYGQDELRFAGAFLAESMLCIAV